MATRLYTSPKARLQLRPLQTQDAEALAHMANNRKIWNNLRNRMPHPYGLEDARTFLAIVEQEVPQQTLGIVCEGDLVGGIGLTLKDDVYEGTAELGYWLGEAYWGKGMATQAVGLMTAYGFEELKLRRIFALVTAFNRPSMRALEKTASKPRALPGRP